MRAAAILAGLLLLTAGCIGMGDDSDESESQEVSPDSNSDGAAGDAPGDNSTDHGHEAKPEKHYDNRTGEVEQTNGLFFTRGDPSNETIEVPDTAQNLHINLTAEDGEINGEIFGPDCEDTSGTIGSDCSEDLDTYNNSQEANEGDGGEASWSTDSPNGGNWTVKLYKGDPGTAPVSYTLEFYYVDEHKPAADHHN
jgi:hypothetical protein